MKKKREKHLKLRNQCTAAEWVNIMKKKRRGKKREKEEVKPEVPKPGTVNTSYNNVSNVSDDESKESSVRKRMEKEKELSIKWVNNQIKQEPEDVNESIELPGSSEEEEDDDDDDEDNSLGLRDGNNDSFPQFRGVLERVVIQLCGSKC